MSLNYYIINIVLSVTVSPDVIKTTKLINETRYNIISLKSIVLHIWSIICNLKLNVIPLGGWLKRTRDKVMIKQLKSFAA